MLKFEAAVFGLTGEGHRALRASIPRRDLPPDLDGFTDRPRGTNYVSSWDPYFSAKSFGRWVAFSYTLSDPGQSRAGAVLTRVLLLDTESVGRLVRLDAVFQALQTPELFEAGSIGGVELEADTGIPNSHPTAGALAYTLRTDATTPVVLTLEDDAWDSIVSFWGRLWPAARRDFSFRTLFDPDDLESSPPTVVVTPAVQIPRWRAFRIVPSEIPEVGPIENYFAGSDDLLMSYFVNGIESKSLSNLRPLNALYQYMADWRSSPTIRAANGVLQTAPLVGFVPEKRRAIEAEVLPVLPRLIAAGNLDDIMFLASAPPNHVDSVTREVRDWSFRHWTDSYSETAKLLRRTSRAQPWWRAAILEGLSLAVANPNRSGAHKVWRLLEHEELAELVASNLTAEWEDTLSSTIPANLSRSVALRVAALASTRFWWRLYSLAITIGEADPFPVLLASLPDDKRSLGLGEFAHLKGLQTLVLEAVRLGDARAYPAASRAVVARPEILQHLSLKEPAWLEIWAGAVPALPSPWECVPSPATCWESLWELIRSGKRMPDGLLSCLAKTSNIQILHQPVRVNLWELLPESDREAVLQAAARDWLIEPADPGSPEPILADAILRADLSVEVLTRVASRLVAYLGDRLPPDTVEQLVWLAAHGQVPPLEASEIGRLVAGLRNAKLAKQAVDHVLRHPGPSGLAFTSAVMGILSPITQAWVYFHQPGIGQFEEAVWWQALEHMAIEKAPRGPRELWIRAGGVEAEIPRGHSPAEDWRLALDHIRRGGHPSIWDLLRTIQAEFPHDQAIPRFLASIPHHY